jgi:hypothetical protein
MPLLDPPLVALSRRKAALTRHYGEDDPRTREVASQLRVGRLLSDIGNLTRDEHARLLAALLSR